MTAVAMNAGRLLAHYERIADAPKAIARLRRFILDLAVRGKLVPQDPKEEPASELLKRIATEKARLVRSGEIRKPRDLTDGKGVREPFAIPSTWQWARLDAVGAIIGGGTPSATDADNFAAPGRGIPWLTPADLGGYSSMYISRGSRDLSEKGLRTSSATLMPKGTVLFTSRAPIGYVAIASNPISTNQGFKSIVPYVAECSRFISTAMMTFAPEIDAMAPGTTFREVSGKIVAALPFPLPPLAEQHRIVAKVDELMALCDRLEATQVAREGARDRLAAASLARLNEPNSETFQADASFTLDVLPALTVRPDQIKQLRQTILNLAVRGKVVSQNPKEEPASELVQRIMAQPWPTKKKVSELLPSAKAISEAFPLPVSWRWVTVDFIARPGETVTYGILKPEWVDSGVPTVRVTEMKTGEIDVASLPQCDVRRASKFEKTTLAPGDLLISKDGTIGKTAFVPPELAGGNITQHMLRFPITTLVNRYFIRLSIDAPFCQAWMAGETKGVALQGVNVGDFRRMPIPLPPLAEQGRIVAKVNELLTLCDQLESSLAQTDSKRSELLTALLNEALTPSARAIDAAAE